MSLTHWSSTPISSPITSNNPLRSSVAKTCALIHLRKRNCCISCDHSKKSNQGGDRKYHRLVDRRNILLGLGGLYGTATSTNNSAFGKPLSPPDLRNHHPAIDEDLKYVNCDPSPFVIKASEENNISDFEPHSYVETRIRKPAHKYKVEETEKFERAVKEMKMLPAEHPWSYQSQATIHCTYCNGTYFQPGTKDIDIQVHGSWFFLPWHRYYLYFWERILGHLIGDKNFTVPFWNWDAEEGMYTPQMYLQEGSCLWNDKRNKSHCSKDIKALLSYSYGFSDENPEENRFEEVITNNWSVLKDDVFGSGTLSDPRLFMGGKLRAGDKEEVTIGKTPVGEGRCEHLHNTMHEWVGPIEKPNHDMGNFHTAANDTLFFAHHANVDRMWDIYRDLNKERLDKFYKDDDYLNSSFIFADVGANGEPQVVKVKVKDCINTIDLGYKYDLKDAPAEWTLSENIARIKKQNNKAKKASAGDSQKLFPVAEFGSQPRELLKEPIRALVVRPAISKKDAVEVLVIKGIQAPYDSTARFDVYVAKPFQGLVTPDLGKLAGSFVRVPRGHQRSSLIGAESTGTNLNLGINKELIEYIDAKGSKEFVVSIVPRDGDEVVIGGVLIESYEVGA